MRTERSDIQRVAESVHALGKVRAEFDQSTTDRKTAIISELVKSAIHDPAVLLEYHESLCYLRAYPDSPKLLQSVERELSTFLQRVNLCFEHDRNRSEAVLGETGIVATQIHHTFGLEMCRWLLARFPEAAELDWAAYLQREDDPILALMPLTLMWAENDAVDAPDLPTVDIVDAEVTRRGVSYLKWLIEQYDRFPATDPVRRTLFDKAEYPVVVSVGDAPFARTHIKRYEGRIYYQRSPLRKVYPNLLKEVSKSNLKPTLLKPREARAVLDLHKQTMIVRHRELFPLTHANEQEMYSAQIGSGTTVFVYGMVPEMRLPLESNYAALIVRNGVPIGYGIGAMLCERIEIAINIFDTFRRCEAGYIFGRFAQLYHQLFGNSYLIIRKYQVGFDNPEGIDSGAYWFYYKLGFRSMSKRLRLLAEEEAAKIASEKGYRTERSILKRLAKSDLCLNLTDPEDFSNRDLDLGKIALAQTAFIADRYDGDRKRAEKESVRLCLQRLGMKSLSGWTQREKVWFSRMAPLICILPGLEDWSKRDRDTLIRLTRAKGSIREREYTKLMSGHRAFRAALGAIASE